jgi:hypothetical protein
MTVLYVLPRSLDLSRPLALSIRIATWFQFPPKPSTSYKLPNYPSYKLQATSYKLQATSYKLQATSYKLQATSYKLQATSYKLQATRHARVPRSTLIAARGYGGERNNLPFDHFDTFSLHTITSSRSHQDQRANSSTWPEQD